MAAGVDVVTNANVWVVTYNGSTATYTLPFRLWPLAGYAGPVTPFIGQRLVWIAGDGAMAGDKVVLKDSSATGLTAAGTEFFQATATGADYEPPQEWKRNKYESAPLGCWITTFGRGTLYIYL